MDISPKYSLFIKSPSINKVFTNRISQRRYFHKKINKLLNENFNEVIVYHGVGGIGKSELSQQLKKELNEKFNNLIISEIDFQNPQLNTPSRALLEIKRNISNKNILFPHFDIAYYILFKKKNPLFKYNDKNLPFSEEASLVGGIIGAIDGLGFTGSLVNLVNFAYKKFKKLRLDHKLKEPLNELSTLQVHEIEERLPAFFSYDIERAKVKGSYKSFICFFDTYEYVYKNSTTVNDKLQKDKWIRELLTNLEGSIFVITSREKLFWDIENRNWIKHLKYSLVDCFSNSDAEEYLINCKIEPPEIRKRILQASSGHPYYLDLCIDTYYQLKNQNKKITQKDFASSKNEVFQRFNLRLKKEESEMFKILSISRFYNEGIFIYLLQKFPTGYSISSFSELNRFSFIKQRQDNYYLHDLVKESFLSITSLSIQKSVNDTLLAFYESKLKKFIDIEFFENVELVFDEVIYHAINSLQKPELINWLKNKQQVFTKLQYYGSTQKLCEIFKQILNKLPLKHLPPELFSIYADMVHLGGNFKQAVSLIENYIRIDNIAIDENLLLHLKTRIIHHKMFYSNVNRLKYQIIELLRATNANLYPERYNELLFMIGGNLGLLSGDFEESRVYLEKAIRFSDRNKFYDFKCRSIRKYADILRLNGHPKLSAQFCKKGIDIAESKNYIRYKIYLLCSLADNHRIMKDISASMNYFNIAEKEAENKGIKSWVAHTKLGKSLCNYSIGNNSIAVENLLKAKKTYEFLNLKWGLINCAIIDFIINSPDKSEILKIKKTASQLGYKYEVNIINQIINNNFDISRYHLLFL